MKTIQYSSEVTKYISTSVNSITGFHIPITNFTIGKPLTLVDS